MHRSLPFAFGVLALAASGCDDKPAAPVTTAPAITETPAKTAATATAKPTPSAKPSASVAAGDPGDFGPFHAVAEGSAMTIYPMGDAAVVDTGAFYAVLGASDEIEQDPLLWRASIDKGGGSVTVTAAARYQRFFGAWPDQPWAMLDGTMMKKVGEVWVAQSPLRDGETLLDFTILEGKRALAAIKMTEPDVRFALAASSPGMIPAPGKPTPEQGDCKVRMDPAAPMKLAGVASGHMFAIGQECKSGKPIAERWEPKKARGEAAVIDGVEGAPVAIAAVSDSEAYAFFGSTVATWDGKAWKGEKSPFGAPSAAFASSDGTAWAFTAEGLYRHPKGGAWTKVDTGKAKATSAWAKDEKTIWIVADGKTLLKSGPGTKPAMKLPSAADTQALVEREKRWPATPACKRVYVWLGGIGGAGTKPPQSWAPLTDAVKGNAELTAKEVSYVVEEVGGTLYAGAKLPNVTLGEKLMMAFRAKNEKAKTMMFCHEPMVVKGPLKVE